jgi:acetyl-CoA carboxylase biotin carboxylase subunit
MLTSCLIANRGEIAVRIIRACRELGIRAVVVYSEADARARHVRMADAAFAIGGASPSDSYLHINRLLEAAARTGCDCVHPGYGFLSETEAFAQAVLDAGLTWIGPPPEAIGLMGVKTDARALMQQAGVPLVPGFQSEDATDEILLEAADQIGYPVMVKAAGGGGGKGIRVAYRRDDLPDGLRAARREAQNAFGDGRLFLERFIERARHVEIQIVADTQGSTVHLFERECSAQRRHQKVIEESPSSRLSEEVRAAIGQAAVNAARAVGYVNAGTVEFILTPENEFYFLEMNTRLQVEHPVTEMVTGLDLVRLQFAIAAGEPLPFTQADLQQRGHALECRVYAEDAENGFLPAVGVLRLFLPPEGPGIRVDSGVQTGDEITLHYDPMIAKIIVGAPTREAALRRMDAALRQTVILGTATNLRFLRWLVNHPAFQAGEVDTAFIESHLGEFSAAAGPPPDEALIAAALHDFHSAQERRSGFAGDTGTVYDPWSQSDGYRIGENQ